MNIWYGYNYKPNRIAGGSVRTKVNIGFGESLSTSTIGAVSDHSLGFFRFCHKSLNLLFCLRLFDLAFLCLFRMVQKKLSLLSK